MAGDGGEKNLWHICGENIFRQLPESPALSVKHSVEYLSPPETYNLILALFTPERSPPSLQTSLLPES
ncbi:hypothetical protein AOLI_G00084040 [Acnodon oligacanthus]